MKRQTPTQAQIIKDMSSKITRLERERTALIEALHRVHDELDEQAGPLGSETIFSIRRAYIKVTGKPLASRWANEAQ